MHFPSSGDRIDAKRPQRLRVASRRSDHGRPQRSRPIGKGAVQGIAGPGFRTDLRAGRQEHEFAPAGSVHDAHTVSDVDWLPDNLDLGAAPGGQHSGQLADFVMGALPGFVSHPLRRTSYGDATTIPAAMRPSRPKDERFAGLSGPNVNVNVNNEGVMSQKEQLRTINAGITAGTRGQSIAHPLTMNV
jgi:hypothetical protein